MKSLPGIYADFMYEDYKFAVLQICLLMKAFRRTRTKWMLNQYTNEPSHVPAFDPFSVIMS